MDTVTQQILVRKLAALLDTIIINVIIFNIFLMISKK